MHPRFPAALSALLVLLLVPRHVPAADELAALREELERTKALVTELSQRLAVVEARSTAPPPVPTVSTAVPLPVTPVQTAAAAAPNAFNPAISAVLQGSFNAYAEDPEAAVIAGFALGEEAGPDSEGFSLGESELNLAANIDPLFYGSVTVALEDDAGETEVALEEAFIETLALPYGVKAKAGRMFPAFGYLNEIHAHADAFVDRPLPYRAFLGADNYRDDGMQLSVLMPTALYAELGGGWYRGIGFPAAGSASDGTGAQTAFARLGGDIGIAHSWRAGVSFLRGEAVARETDELVFDGTTHLYAADAKYTWGPGGNHALTLQGEYVWRNEEGAWNEVPYDENASGWYAQAVYRLGQRWQAGYRYARMSPPDVPADLVATALDSAGHDPLAHSIVIQWSPSEFSSLRVQYTRDDSGPVADDVAVLRYTVSLGAHGAHPY
jgi:hypothetical protein